ncbi:MAG: hypothetical protein ABI162_08885 [Luteolibacter sp.]
MSELSRLDSGSLPSACRRDGGTAILANTASLPAAGSISGLWFGSE